MLKTGDTIECRDKDDMLDTYMSLEKLGIDSDFMYEKDGEKGLWLIITKGEENECN